jgi:hypothetical protein
MNQPKYQSYYLQIGNTDCTLVINETDYDEPIEIEYPSDEYRSSEQRSKL